MGAAAGLQIDLAHGDHAHLPGARRRFHGHGAHQLRAFSQLRIADPAYGHREILLHQLADLFRQGVLVETGIGDIEIKPALARADRTSRNRVGEDGTQQMKCCVNPHMGVAIVPVENALHLIACLRHNRSLPRNMDDGAAAGSINGGGNRNFAAIGARQFSCISGLATTGRVKNRSVEYDAAEVVDGQNFRLASFRVAVLAKQFPGFAHCVTSGISGAGRSSHAGTGNPFSFRTAGLNNLLW